MGGALSVARVFQEYRGTNPVLGDEGFARELYRSIQDLRLYVAGRIPSRFRAVVGVDDILQEVWLDADRLSRDFASEDPGAMTRWLRTIADHKVIDVLRRLRAKRRGGDRRCVGFASSRSEQYSNLFDRLVVVQDTPSREIRRGESAHAVAIGLLTLGEDRRRAIVMRYVDGMERAAIAAAMGKSAAAINSLLFHGLRQLRDALGSATQFLSAQ